MVGPDRENAYVTAGFQIADDRVGVGLAGRFATLQVAPAIQQDATSPLIEHLSLDYGGGMAISCHVRHPLSVVGGAPHRLPVDRGVTEQHADLLVRGQSAVHLCSYLQRD